METQKINAKGLFELGCALSSKRPLMVRGKHGIGKSEIIYQIASKRFSNFFENLENCQKFTQRAQGEASVQKIIENFWEQNKTNTKYNGYPRDIWHYDMGLPLIERRLSQLSDGDLVGVPKITERQTTTFNIADWLVIPMEFPCVLFLDELNRASRQNEQSTFQLADSRAFYGRSLHKDTWMVVAVNTGSNYDVIPMDHAAISRYAVVDYEPLVEEWIEFARAKVDPNLIGFILLNQTLLDTPKNVKPESKTQDRRAFINLDLELKRLNLYDNPQNPLFLWVAGSMVGTPAAIQLRSYLLENYLRYSVEEVLENWEKFKKRLSPNKELYGAQIIDLVGRLGDWLPNNPLTKPQAEQFALMFIDIPVEFIQMLFSYVAVLAHNNPPNKAAMKAVASYLQRQYVK